MTFKTRWEKTDQLISIKPHIIEEMLRVAMPGKTLFNYEVISGGCANYNIKIQLQDETELVLLRIFVRDPSAALREQNLGKLLGQVIPVPQIYYIGEVEGYCFAVVEYIQGITLRELIMENPGISLDGVMYEVGLILARFGDFQFESSGFFDEHLKVIRKFSDDFAYSFASSCLENPQTAEYISHELIAKIKFRLKKLKRFFPKNENRLVHGDFDPANILVRHVKGKWVVVGILDWEFAFSGSPLCDVANMLRYAHQTVPEFESAFIDGLNDAGFHLPPNWRVSVDLLNILALLDFLTKPDLTNKPNQLTDIKELLGHILNKLDEYYA